MAMHGNRVTSVHHEELGVNADGHANAPPSRAAAAATPAGACRVYDYQNILLVYWVLTESKQPSPTHLSLSVIIRSCS
jgi:hypothetical protein